MGTLVVHVQPRARRSEIVGAHGDAVKVRLAAPPVDGAANDELVRFLAERLGVHRSTVTIAAGARGRRKRVAIQGMGTDEARRRLLNKAARSA